MTTTTLIFSISAVAAIVLALLFREKVTASILGFKIKTDSKASSNQASIHGNENDVSQKSPKTSAVSTRKNNLTVDGNSNKVSQE